MSEGKPVSPPPLTMPIANEEGVINRNWQIWFRDIYGMSVFKVSDLTQIAINDIGSAPATYSQSYAQQQTDLCNANKAVLNSVITTILK